MATRLQSVSLAIVVVADDATEGKEPNHHCHEGIADAAYLIGLHLVGMKQETYHLPDEKELYEAGAPSVAT